MTDDEILIALATPATIEDAIATLEARTNPAAYFARHCMKRAESADTDAKREWWKRLAGNARKAACMHVKLTP